MKESRSNFAFVLSAGLAVASCAGSENQFDMYALNRRGGAGINVATGVEVSDKKIEEAANKTIEKECPEGHQCTVLCIHAGEGGPSCSMRDDGLLVSAIEGLVEKRDQQKELPVIKVGENLEKSFGGARVDSVGNKEIKGRRVIIIDLSKMPKAGL